MREECFEANEYVAACWQVACAVGIAGGNTANGKKNNDTIETNIPGVNHTQRSDHSGCGWAENQVIVSSADGSYSMWEENVRQYNRLGCTILDAGGNAASLSSSPNIGDTIYWKTSGQMGGQTVTWSHYGTVESASNHS